MQTRGRECEWRRDRFDARRAQSPLKFQTEWRTTLGTSIDDQVGTTEGEAHVNVPPRSCAYSSSAIHACSSSLLTPRRRLVIAKHTTSGVTPLPADRQARIPAPIRDGIHALSVSSLFALPGFYVQPGFLPGQICTYGHPRRRGNRHRLAESLAQKITLSHAKVTIHHHPGFAVAPQ